METTKKTPLYQQHVQLKAKIVDFSGWQMPVFYESVLVEHKCVRNSVGIFDVSHMGEIRIQGPQAAEFLSHLAINDIHALKTKHGQYTAMCVESGGFVDDLIVYKLADDDFLLCVNASNTDKDYQWIESKRHAFPKVRVVNESENWGQIAIQGPHSTACLQTLLSPSDAKTLETLEYMQILPINIFGQASLIARTGYTGEKGYEIYSPPQIAEQIWTTLLEKGQSYGIRPIGLGARDTLRLEACYLLYGNDMDETISPLEAGISWAVKFTHDFIGKSALLEQKEAGLKRKLHGFIMTDNGIPRHGMDVIQNDKKIGVVSSGSVLPTVGGSGGLALLAVDALDRSQPIFIDIRGNEKAAKIVPTPLYAARIKSK